MWSGNWGLRAAVSIIPAFETGHRHQAQDRAADVNLPGTHPTHGLSTEAETRTCVFIERCRYVS